MREGSMQGKAAGKTPGIWIPHTLVGALAFLAGSLAPAGVAPGAQRPTVEHARAGVTGIGGVFFKSPNPAVLMAWFGEHLGISVQVWGGVAFQWRETGRPDEIGYTVWNAFPDTTTYLAPGSAAFMVNFRVTDLAELVSRLRARGVEIVGEIERHPNGSFAWILDPEGRKVELWEPVPSKEDPYLVREVP